MWVKEREGDRWREREGGGRMGGRGRDACVITRNPHAFGGTRVL